MNHHLSTSAFSFLQNMVKNQQLTGRWPRLSRSKQWRINDDLLVRAARTRAKFAGPLKPPFEAWSIPMKFGKKPEIWLPNDPYLIADKKGSSNTQIHLYTLPLDYVPGPVAFT